MNGIEVPISPGELLDKITILRIKSRRMHDPQKLANVRVELDALQSTWNRSAPAEGDLATSDRGRHRGAADGQRAPVGDRGRHPRQGAGGRRSTPSSSASRAAVYRENDERAAIKRRINTTLGSRIVEEKSYQSY